MAIDALAAVFALSWLVIKSQKKAQKAQTILLKAFVT
jgi:hypothetical protein